MMQHMLEAAGYDVAVARDGEECLAMAWQAPPDLLLLDIMMPKRHASKSSDVSGSIRPHAICGW